MIKEFLEKQRKTKFQKQLAKQKLIGQAMRAEIINTIQFEVRKEQKTEEVNIPFFLEVQRRLDLLNISTFRDLAKTYQQFAKEGRVSGVLNV